MKTYFNNILHWHSPIMLFCKTIFCPLGQFQGNYIKVVAPHQKFVQKLDFFRHVFWEVNAYVGKTPNCFDDFFWGTPYSPPPHPLNTEWNYTPGADNVKLYISLIVLFHICHRDSIVNYHPPSGSTISWLTEPFVYPNILPVKYT